MKVIFFLILFILSGCDGKLSSLSQSTCDSIKKDVISKSLNNIYEITDIHEASYKTEPTTLNLPGKIILVCDGIGFTQQGGKVAINFFMTDYNGKNYIAYEADEGKFANDAIKSLQNSFKSLIEGTQNNDANRPPAGKMDAQQTENDGLKLDDRGRVIQILTPQMKNPMGSSNNSGN